jgi:hypothetical protein
MPAQVYRLGWKNAFFMLAPWVGIACWACCGAKHDAPVVHVGYPAADSGSPSPVADPEFPPASPPVKPQGPTPPSSPSARQVWCHCPADVPSAWCPCPQLGIVIPEPPPQPLSKNVPDRACKKDRECGDGLCDRGRCAPLWTEDPKYGQSCNVSSISGLCDSGYLCLEGRCRSCVSDAECVKEMPGSACGFYRSPESRRRRCGREVSSVGPPGPPLPQPSSTPAQP